MRQNWKQTDNADDLAIFLLQSNYVEQTAASMSTTPITPTDLEDLKSYIILWILEHREKIQTVIKTGKMEHFLWGMIYKQARSNTSWFKTKLQSPRTTPYPEFFDNVYEEKDSILED